MSKFATYKAIRRPSPMNGGKWNVFGEGNPGSAREGAEKLVKALRSDFVETTGIMVVIHDASGNYLDTVDIPKVASVERVEHILSLWSEGGEDIVLQVDRVGQGYRYHDGE